MSRGLGKTEMGIIRALGAREPRSLTELASEVYGEERPSRAAYVATTRAVRGLTRRGWTSSDGRWRCRVKLTPSARLALYMTTHTA